MKKTVWVCAACGKRSNDKRGKSPIDRMWDVSCMLHAVLCYDDAPEGYDYHTSQHVWTAVNDDSRSTS
jgi:hypothetical protein